MPVEHEREKKSQKIGAFLLQIVFFLTDFAEFRVKLVFCIQAEIIISSISTKYPTVERRSKVIMKIALFREKLTILEIFFQAILLGTPLFL